MDRLFRKARTCSKWRPIDVPMELLHEIYELLRWPPTALNSHPTRFVFLTTPESKQRLVPALMPKNVEKTLKAPVTTIIAWDTEFYEKLPKLMPQSDMRSYYVGKQALIDDAAFRNSSLQGAYFMLAARALGLDCGPMSGFDAEKVNAEFFPDGQWKSNFLCNIGYGDISTAHPRNPRLEFDEACLVL